MNNLNALKVASDCCMKFMVVSEPDALGRIFVSVNCHRPKEGCSEDMYCLGLVQLTERHLRLRADIERITKK